MSSAILVGLTAPDVPRETDDSMRGASLWKDAAFDDPQADRVFGVADAIDPEARWWAASTTYGVDLDRVYRLAEEIRAGTWDWMLALTERIPNLGRVRVLLVDLGDSHVEGHGCETIEGLLRSIAIRTEHGAPLGCVHWWCDLGARREGEGSQGVGPAGVLPR